MKLETPEELWHNVDARAVFRKLGARIVYLYREPIDQYLSIQRGRRSELRGSGTAWHCFEANQSKCPAKPKLKGDDRLDINVRDAAFFVIEALRLQRQAHSFGPLFTSTFENCVKNASFCVDQIYGTLGLSKRTKSVLAARVSSSLNVVRNLDELKETLAAVEAGNWSSSRKSHRGGARGVSVALRGAGKGNGTSSEGKGSGGGKGKGKGKGDGAAFSPSKGTNATRGVARVREIVAQPALVKVSAQSLLPLRSLATQAVVLAGGPCHP